MRTFSDIADRDTVLPVQVSGQARQSWLDRRVGSICPSEAARVVGGEQWRDLMGATREAARALARAGQVEITQRGAVLAPMQMSETPIRMKFPAPKLGQHTQDVVSALASDGRWPATDRAKAAE